MFRAASEDFSLAISSYEKACLSKSEDVSLYISVNKYRSWHRSSFNFAIGDFCFGGMMST